MNKYVVWASVFAIPLLYELCRRVAGDHYLFAALALHWVLAAAVLIWTKRALTGPKDIGLPGVVKGFFCFACCLGAYCVALNLVFGSMPLGDWQWSLPGMTTFKRWGVVVMGLSAGFCEEVIYRGYMMTALKKIGQPVWSAMVASSLSFVFFHGLLPVPMLVSGFVIAMIWAAIVQRTSLLWTTVYIHGFWDASVALIPWYALFVGGTGVMTRQERASVLRFETIDLDRHSDLCIQYRRDSYACSFADGELRFARENGEDGRGYIDWLERRILDLPQGCVHAWRGEAAVGQIESRIRDDGSGYVNLFYLAPHARGCGLGRELNRYAIELFTSLGVAVARLTVSAHNESALGFYRRMGWKELGPRPGRQDALLFEFRIDETDKT